MALSSKTTAAGITFAIAAALSTAIVHAGAANAAPPGTVNCTSGPAGSRLEATCTNTDPGAGTGALTGLCSNLRVINLVNVRIAPNSTERFGEDCGPGAHAILWNAGGETDLQRMNRQTQEQQQKLRDQQRQFEQQREQHQRQQQQPQRGPATR